MAFETVRRFLDGVYYNQDDMANSFNGVFGNLNNITANVSGLNVVLSGGYVLLNGYFINFVGVDTVAVTANASGFIYVSYDFSDDTYSISYAATIPADSDTVKNLGIYSTVSNASAVTLTKINNNDSMFAIINGAIVDINNKISTINGNIATINKNLGYKFDLGSIGTVKNVQNSSGVIFLTSIDLNTIQTTGLYYANNCPGRPTSTDGWVEVYGGSTTTNQLYYANNQNYDAPMIFQRVMYGSSWGRWYLIHGNMLLSSGSAAYVDGGRIGIPLDTTKRYGSLLIEVVDIATGNTVLGVVDFKLDPMIANETVRASNGSAATTGTTSSILLDIRFTFNTADILINVVKQTSISNTGTISVTARRIGRIWGLPK